MTRAPIHYSHDEMNWLEANRMMVISDYHRAFVEKFSRTDVAATHLHGLRKRKGWKVGRDPSRYKGRRLKYSVDEVAWLQDNCTLPINEYHRQFCSKFGRDDTTAAQLHGLRKREGWKTGRTGQFAVGSVPANKGKKMPFNANSATTQFKKGQLPHNFRGAGHESIGDDGYVWVVTDQTNPWTGASTWRVHKHRWLWEQQNGPVPDGHILKCLDGNKLNTEPSNWKAIPQGVLPRLNSRFGRSYDQAPAELKPTIMAVSQLEHAAHQLRRREKSNPKRNPT